MDSCNLGELAPGGFTQNRIHPSVTEVQLLVIVDG